MTNVRPTTIRAVDAELTRLRRENEAMRAALEQIASGTATSSGDVQGATWAELNHVRIARAALEGTR